MASGVQSSASASSIPPRIAAALRGLHVISASRLTNVSFADKGLLMGECVRGNESPPPARFPTTSLPEIKEQQTGPGNRGACTQDEKTTPTSTAPPLCTCTRLCAWREGALGTMLEGIPQSRCMATSWCKSIHLSIFNTRFFWSSGLQGSAGVCL